MSIPTQKLHTKIKAVQAVDFIGYFSRVIIEWE